MAYIAGDPLIPAVVLTEQAAAPANPTAGKEALYVTTGGVLTLKNAAGTVSPVAGTRAGALCFTLGDGVNAITATEPDQWVEVPRALTVTSWRLLADAAGSIVVDVWRDSYANAPPTVADSIAASAKPTLAAAQKNQDVILTGWTKTLAAGDWLRVHVESAATCKRVVLSLGVTG